jgi:glutaminyl-peptide cyclotransferase
MLVTIARAFVRPFAVGLMLGACSGSDAAEGQGAAVRAVEFDGAAAIGYVRRQVEFGPRVPGTAPHRAMGDWLVAELRTRADTVIVQEWTHTTADGKRLPMRNVLARFKPSETRRVLYVAHWDTRPVADKETDPAKAAMPVPGGNDGGSGVAILMGVADALKKAPANVGVDLLFVDGEDWGNFESNTDVLIGSTYFADHLPSATYAPELGVVWDMVGDEFPVFQFETNSLQAAPEVVQRVWATAKRLGYETTFQSREYGPITDDHLPLIRKGLKVIDVIDLDYPWHHTTEDTADKVSQRTLQIVGDVAMALLREF